MQYHSTKRTRLAESYRCLLTVVKMGGVALGRVAGVMGQQEAGGAAPCGESCASQAAARSGVRHADQCRGFTETTGLGLWVVYAGIQPVRRILKR
jgi:hypothetical protein